MIVLVTGSTGFVGREVVKALCSRGLEVRCLVHTPGSESVFEGRPVDVHYGSVGDPAALSAAFYDVDVVVHLVARIRERDSATFQDVNRKGTENVVAAAVDDGVKHFIYMSAIGAAENHRYRYLYSKWLAEQAVIRSGLPYTILRPSIQFGPGDEFINALAGLVRVFPVVPIAGSGRARLQPIAVDEVARCVADAACRDDLNGKIIEIGGPDHLTYNDIVDIIARTFRARRLKLHVPLRLMRLIVRFMEILLPRPPATREQLRMVSMPNVTQLGTVEAVFEFKPRPLQGNIEYVKGIGAWDGVKIALGSIPNRIRDH